MGAMAVASLGPFILFVVLSSFSPLVLSDSNDDLQVTVLGIGNSTVPHTGINIYGAYENNVFSLLSELASESAKLHPPLVGFFNATTGAAPSRAYGYYFCRGDLKPKVCHDCVSQVTQSISKQLNIYFEGLGFAGAKVGYHCMVHYANRSIGYRDDFVFSYGRIEGKVSDYQQYNETLRTTVEGLIREAAQGNWTRPGFETRVVDVAGNSHEKLYTLVQCTPDISATNCSNCLGQLYPELVQCCGDVQGGMVIHPNCWMMYNDQPFFGHAYRGFLPTYLHFCVTLLLSLYLLHVT